jgi:hypothetical protein
MKVIVNEHEVTYFNDWMRNPGWRYLAVTVIKNFMDTSNVNDISSSQVKIYLDRTLAGVLKIPSSFKDDQSDPTEVIDRFGYNFRGVIKMVRLQASMFCGAT